MLVSLQILRAAAASLVALAHFSDANGAGPTTFQFGALGVDIFFIISGLVMVYSSGRLFGQPGATRTFLVNRIARIVPLYWGATILGMLLYFSVGGAAPPAVSFACSFLFVPCGSEHGVPLLGVGWTLNYEMFFYVLFGACLLLHRRLAVIAVSLLLGLCVAAGSLWQLPLPFLYWFHPIVLEFVFGALLGLVYAEGIRVPMAVCGTLMLCGIAASLLSG
jgi:peptidoglycan/LPS O-acetylase OafA/YrhL